MSQIRFCVRMLLTAALAGVLLSGCDREEGESPAFEQVYPAENGAYVYDPAFQKALGAQNAARNGLAKDRFRVQQEMDALVRACGGDRAAAERRPEWAALAAEAGELEKAFEEQRRRTRAIVRERLQRAAADSERIQRGEAVAVPLAEGRKVDFTGDNK